MKFLNFKKIKKQNDINSNEIKKYREYFLNSYYETATQQLEKDIQESEQDDFYVDIPK